MPAQAPVQIPFPLSSVPGANPQESAGRLINAYVEPMAEGDKRFKTIRSAGLSQHAVTGNSGYRGGLTVKNLAYECWSGNASTVDAGGDVTSIGSFPGTRPVSMAQNQASPIPDVVAVDLDNGAYVLGSASVLPASITATISGTNFNQGDVVTLTFLNPALAYLSDFQVPISYTLVAGDTAASVASALNTAINANATLTANHIASTVAGAVLTIKHQGSIGNQTSLVATVATDTKIVGSETITLNPTSGALTNGSATATIGGTTFNSGDIVAISFVNPDISSFPVSIIHTLTAGETASTVAAALNALINSNATLAANKATSSVSGAIIAISQSGSDSNNTTLVSGIVSGGETVTFSPTSGDLAGGQGTYGAFSGIPTVYTANAILPQPNSICFQDGYFFFTIGSNQVYASGLNSLYMNALTYITVQAKADVSLLRGVAFSGLLLLFTSGSCEVWQDAANPAPNFPYSRIAVLEFGLLQSTAIAGWETGFSELLWVAQDFGVHWMTSGQLGQIKVSPPDLDRLIEAEVRAGNTLTAGVYGVAGKKFWVLSSPDWTWEFNLQTRKWSERWSLTSGGVYGQWRGVGGHPAFGKWLVGDAQSGNLLWPDDTNPTENGTPMLWRIESDIVTKFPAQQRIARADFDFVVGVGQAVGSVSTSVLGTSAGANGVVRLQVTSTARMATGDVVGVVGVTGTTEANGNWSINVVDATHIDLQATAYANAYASGGTVTDLTAPNNQQNPTVAISMSKDGGQSWGNPLLRPLGSQASALRSRVSILNQGLSGPMGVRWRIDVTDPVYASLLGATMSSDIRA